MEPNSTNSMYLDSIRTQFEDLNAYRTAEMCQKMLGIVVSEYAPRYLSRIYVMKYPGLFYNHLNNNSVFI